MRTKPLLPLALFLGLLTPSVAPAQWVVNGNPIATPTGPQDWISITPNGLGGAVMVWQDNRTGTFPDIYARQVTNTGAVEWTSNGIPLCTAAGGQLYPKVIHDGFGYLQYVWQDFRNGNADLYLATTDRLGNIFTPANGLPLCTAAGEQGVPSMVLYPASGVFFTAWTDKRSANDDIYYASFSQSSGITTPADGSPVCTLPSVQQAPAVSIRFPNAAVVAWQDFRNGNYDIYAQTMTATGTPGWAANGVAVCTQASAQLSPMIVEDTVGGVIVAWEDRRHGTFVQAIYAQRLDSAGNKLWAADGVPIAISSDLIALPKMLSDGVGGAFFAWEDDRNIATTGPDIYAQRVDASGAVQWAANGAVVCSASFAQYGADLAWDGSGGIVVTWFDYRTLGPTDVYAQRMNSVGTPVWTANGIPVSAATGNQANPHIVQSEPGAYIVAWEDRRTFGTTDTDVYAQRITASGAYGYPQPFITSIIDVPSDEGGYVRVTFTAGDGAVPGEEYEIYNNDYHGGDVVGLVTGNGSPSYTTDVLTVGVGAPNSFYVYSPLGISNVVAGTSYDNLAPPAPTLAGQRNGNNVELSWNSTAPDIAYYIMQRSDLGSWNVNGLSYIDMGAPMTELNYRMNAVDIHGNVSNNSNGVTIDAATGIGDTPSIPKALTLLPNSPNPFNGSTALHIGMPKAGDVRLEVYDVAGRRVATRNAGQLAAGWREVSFDGRTDGGQPLASGVYFYRVYAGGEMHTRKMVISR